MKKFKTITISLCLMVLSINLFGAELLVDWDFDNINNNTLPDSVDHNTGYISGDLVDKYIHPGLFGQSFEFDGTGRNIIEIPDSADISLLNDFTVEYIMMPFSLNGYRTILWKGKRTITPNQMNYYIGFNGDKIELKAMDSSGLWTVFNSPSILTINNWYHVLIYYNNGECDFYVNGSKIAVYSSVDANSSLGDSLLGNSYDGVIGAGQTSTGAEAYYFHGLIDNMKIWSGKAVTPGIDYSDLLLRIQDYEQIMTNWTPDLSSSLSPVVQWNFDDITNSILPSVFGNCDGYIAGGSVARYVRPGLFGESFYFNNGTHPIEIPHSEDISLSNDFTIEYVIRPYNVSWYNNVLWKGERSGDPDVINYYTGINDGRIELKALDSTGLWTIFLSPSILTANNWYHVIIYYKDGECEFYVNGTQISVSKYVAPGSSLGDSLRENSYDGMIGASQVSTGASSYFFDGLIDDIKIRSGRVVNPGIDYRYEWADRIDYFNDEIAAIALAESVIDETAATEYATFYGSTTAPFLATVMPASSRLVHNPMFFESINSIEDQAKISAAQNEYEGFQVICLGQPVASPITVSISCSALTLQGGTETIPVENITLGAIKNVTSEVPDIPVDFTGSIPDVIQNGTTTFGVSQQNFSSVFVKIFTENASPGTYAGTITLTCGTYQKQISVEMKVYNFELPKKGSLKTSFSFDEHYYETWYGVSPIPESTKTDIYDFFLSYRISPGDIYSQDAVSPSISQLNGIKPQTNFFTIKGSSPTAAVTTSKLNIIITEARTTIANVTSAGGLLDDMYYYSYDEVPASSLPGVVQVNSALMYEFPDLRMMQTSFPTAAIENYFNVWVPLIDHFRYTEKLDILANKRDDGEEIWWYVADTPNHPFPNYFLDYPVFDCRILGMLSYMYDIEGTLYWRINREWATNDDIKNTWPTTGEWKPYINNINTGARIYKNGMGNLVYPGLAGKLYPSLRLENLRDGFEDNEYLVVLKTFIERAKAVENESTEIIIDNSDAGFTILDGTWNTSTSGTPYGTDARYCTVIDKTAEWTASLDGSYKVYVWYTDYSNRTETALYTIKDSTGVTLNTYEVNQKSGGGAWVLLGTHTFNTAAYVELETQVAGEVAIADAVKFVKEVIPPTLPLIIQAEALLNVPANVATAVNSYSPDPQNLLDYRNDIASMIELLNIPKYQ